MPLHTKGLIFVNTKLEVIMKNQFLLLFLGFFLLSCNTDENGITAPGIDYDLLNKLDGKWEIECYSPFSDEYDDIYELSNGTLNISVFNNVVRILQSYNNSSKSNSYSTTYIETNTERQFITLHFQGYKEESIGGYAAYVIYYEIIFSFKFINNNSIEGSIISPISWSYDFTGTRVE
jgi:hypothetical protein